MSHPLSRAGWSRTARQGNGKNPGRGASLAVNTGRDAIPVPSAGPAGQVGPVPDMTVAPETGRTERATAMAMTARPALTHRAGTGRPVDMAAGPAPGTARPIATAPRSGTAAKGTTLGRTGRRTTMDRRPGTARMGRLDAGPDMDHRASTVLMSATSVAAGMGPGRAMVHAVRTAAVAGTVHATGIGPGPGPHRSAPAKATTPGRTMGRRQAMARPTGTGHRLDTGRPRKATAAAPTGTALRTATAMAVTAMTATAMTVTATRMATGQAAAGCPTTGRGGARCRQSRTRQTAWGQAPCRAGAGPTRPPGGGRILVRACRIDPGAPPGSGPGLPGAARTAVPEDGSGPDRPPGAVPDGDCGPGRAGSPTSGRLGRPRHLARCRQAQAMAVTPARLVHRCSPRTAQAS